VVSCEWHVITRIELHDFMSHRKTVIEPSPGLTVLIGPNNCGKSALVAALQILCHNENSTYVKRHGAKECAVVVHTSEGHVVEWRRKSSPRYVINGQQFDRLRNSGVPDELHSFLRLPLVADDDDDSFNVHFGSQKSPIFLLNSKAGTAARFFASSSDASRLIAMQERHRLRTREAKQRHQRYEAQARKLTEELEVLQGTVSLEDHIADIEQRHAELARFSVGMAQLESAGQVLAGQAERVDHLTAISDSLMSLESPPVLLPVEPLEGCIGRLASVAFDRARLEEGKAVWSRLESPPRLDDDESLEAVVAALELSARVTGRLEGESDCLRLLPAPPLLSDVGHLQERMERLTGLERDVEATVLVCDRLRSLDSPPVPAETAALEQFIEQLTVQRTKLAVHEERSERLDGLRPPEATIELRPLEGLVDLLAQATTRADHLQRQVDELHEDVRRASAALREAVKEEVCPTCGQPFDAERLMAMSDGGGHVHG
jgi:DNA repair ATPase RecN